MTKTKYYDLQMDDPQDDYDVEVVNANLKKIDEQMKIRENATDALQEPEFTVADKRENIASKEKISKILGKIAKFFTDLKTVAFTGSYKDLSNKPTSLPASDVSAWAKANTKPTYTKAEVGLGNVDNTADANKSVKYATSAGNATKVNNYTVNANVPSGAKFTDTTYGVATTTKTGIVKPDGKTITADKDGTLHGADTIKVDGITITRDDATKVIALAKTLQDKIGTIGNKVDKNYVVNNLTTTKQGFVLDGRQGKALQDQITSLNGSLKIEENPNVTIVNGAGEVLNYKCGNLSMISIEITPSKITHGLILATGIYTPVRSFYLSFITIDGHAVPLFLNSNGELSIYYPNQTVESPKRIDGSFAYICA